jgi:hypothetical protein
MLATIQKGEAAGRRNLRAQLILERLTGKVQEKSFQSQAMADGIEREDDASNLYEQISGKLLRSVGFCAHEELMAGFSPDGVYGDFVGIVEAKCPIPATHLDYIRTGTVPVDYVRQATHGLWITGAQWCDWISYQPDFPPSLRVRMVRIERNEQLIAEHDAKVRAFLEEVERELEALLTLSDLRGTLKAAVA